MARVTKAQKQAVAEEASSRIKQFGPTAVLPIRGDPPHPLKQGDGEIEVALGGEYFVTMSGAGFMAMWRYAEAHALQLHNNPSPHARPFETVFLELAESFRRASGQSFDEPEVKPRGAKKWADGAAKPAPKTKGWLK